MNCSGGAALLVAMGWDIGDYTKTRHFWFDDTLPMVEQGTIYMDFPCSTVTSSKSYTTIAYHFLLLGICPDTRVHPFEYLPHFKFTNLRILVSHTLSV